MEIVDTLLQKHVVIDGRSPHSRTTMEDPVDLAVKLYHIRPHATICGIAEEAKVGRKALSDRLNGRHRSRKQSAATKLSKAQESILLARINRSASFGTLLAPRQIRHLANLLSNEVVGINWASKFVKRHKNELNSAYFDSQERTRSSGAKANPENL